MRMYFYFSGIGFSDRLRIDNGDGFLVNPVSSKLYPTNTQSVETQQFYIYNQNTATKITAQFGSLKAEHNITYALNDYSGPDPFSLRVVSVDNGANISAHLIHTTVTNTKPYLRVLIHSDRELHANRCAKVYVKRGKSETVSESCILTNSNRDSSGAVTCVASAPLPYEWWSTREIDVYYSIESYEECTTKSNYIRPLADLPPNAHSVGEAILMFDDRNLAREIRGDANVGLSVPDKPQQVGAPFTVTVKLHPGSELTLFLIK